MPAKTSIVFFLAFSTAIVGTSSLTCGGPDSPNSYPATGNTCEDQICPDVERVPCLKYATTICKCSKGFCRTAPNGLCNQTVPVCGGKNSPNSHLAYGNPCGDSLCSEVPQLPCVLGPEYFCQCDSGYCRPSAKLGTPCSERA